MKVCVEDKYIWFFENRVVRRKERGNNRTEKDL
jgi:hypothetical protein